MNKKIAISSNTIEIFFSNSKKGLNISSKKVIYKLLEHIILIFINTKEGWKLEEDKGGFRIQYKVITNTKLIALRIETHELDISMMTLITILYEIDLYKNWLPFCRYG